jgi:hypothetical protein
MKELTKLRVSVARIAQAAGVSLAVIGVADDAPYEVLCHAAETEERGWNALAAASVEVLIGLRRQ